MWFTRASVLAAYGVMMHALPALIVEREPNAIGQIEQPFDPESRFDRPVASGGPLGTGLAGRGEVNMDTGALSAGELFNLVA